MFWNEYIYINIAVHVIRTITAPSWRSQSFQTHASAATSRPWLLNTHRWWLPGTCSEEWRTWRRRREWSTSDQGCSLPAAAPQTWNHRAEYGTVRTCQEQYLPTDICVSALCKWNNWEQNLHRVDQKFDGHYKATPVTPQTEQSEVLSSHYYARIYTGDNCELRL